MNVLFAGRNQEAFSAERGFSFIVVRIVCGFFAMPAKAAKMVGVVLVAAPKKWSLWESITEDRLYCQK